VRQVYEGLPQGTDPDAIDWLQVPREHDWPEWMAGDLEQADRVERGIASRFIHVPSNESHNGYRDMADFVDTVKNPRLRGQLDQAISSKGAFRRFKNALDCHDSERQRWFAFKWERQRERIRRWLEDEGIQASVRP